MPEIVPKDAQILCVLKLPSRPSKEELEENARRLELQLKRWEKPEDPLAD